MLTRIPSGMALVRIELGITQQQLADTLGVSRALIGMAERGNRRLPQRALEYMDKLRQIAGRVPHAPTLPKRRRPSIATKRPLYNRIHFSSRNNKAGKMHIVTTRSLEPILSPTELRNAGESLRERFYNDGKSYPSAADACRELLLALDQKGAVLQCRLDLLELDSIAARGRALEIKANLVLVNARLKVYRRLYKEHPSLRKRFRRKIAANYLKKLSLQDQLEKCNKPAMVKRKQGIAELKFQLEDLRILAERVRQR